MHCCTLGIATLAGLTVRAPLRRSWWRTKLTTPSGKLTNDRDELLAFYDFPAERWQHQRTTNPIESTFATVRHRTTRTRHRVSRATFLDLAFKLIEPAEQSWRRIRAPVKIASLLEESPSKMACR